MGFLYWLLVIVVLTSFVCICVMFGVLLFSKDLTICKNQANINIEANNFIKNADFKISKKFYINDYETHNQSNDCKKFIAIDSENKKICLIDYKLCRVILANFNEILNYEIYENGNSVTFGVGLGALWSGFFGAKTNSLCKDLKLIIRLKKYDTSQVCYDIITNTRFNLGINKSNEIYKNCISSLQEVVSFLEVVKNENEINNK